MFITSIMIFAMNFGARPFIRQHKPRDNTQPRVRADNASNIEAWIIARIPNLPDAGLQTEPNNASLDDCVNASMPE